MGVSSATDGFASISDLTTEPLKTHQRPCVSLEKGRSRTTSKKTHRRVDESRQTFFIGRKKQKQGLRQKEEKESARGRPSGKPQALKDRHTTNKARVPGRGPQIAPKRDLTRD